MGEDTLFTKQTHKLYEYISDKIGDGIQYPDYSHRMAVPMNASSFWEPSEPGWIRLFIRSAAFFYICSREVADYVEANFTKEADRTAYVKANGCYVSYSASYSNGAQSVGMDVLPICPGFCLYTKNKAGTQDSLPVVEFLYRVGVGSTTPSVPTPPTTDPSDPSTDDPVITVGSGLPIGAVFAFAAMNTEPPAGTYVLNGQTITDCRGTYSEFWEWLNASNVRKIDKATHEAECDTTGACDGFVIDETTGDVVLPKWNCLSIGGSVRGNGMTLGLQGDSASPNLGLVVSSTSTDILASAAVYGKDTGTAISTFNADAKNQSVGVTEDASKSGLVVDAKSEYCNWCIQVYNSASTLSEQDSAKLASAMQLKAQTNLRNVNDDGKQFILDQFNWDPTTVTSRSVDTWYVAETTLLASISALPNGGDSIVSLWINPTGESTTSAGEAQCVRGVMPKAHNTTYSSAVFIVPRGAAYKGTVANSRNIEFITYQMGYTTITTTPPGSSDPDPDPEVGDTYHPDVDDEDVVVGLRELKTIQRLLSGTDADRELLKSTWLGKQFTMRIATKSRSYTISGKSDNPRYSFAHLANDTSTWEDEDNIINVIDPSTSAFDTLYKLSNGTDAVYARSLMLYPGDPVFNAQYEFVGTISTVTDDDPLDVKLMLTSVDTDSELVVDDSTHNVRLEFINPLYCSTKSFRTLTTFQAEEIPRTVMFGSSGGVTNDSEVWAYQYTPNKLTTGSIPKAIWNMMQMVNVPYIADNSATDVVHKLDKLFTPSRTELGMDTLVYMGDKTGTNNTQRFIPESLREGMEGQTSTLYTPAYYKDEYLLRYDNEPVTIGSKKGDAWKITRTPILTNTGSSNNAGLLVDKAYGRMMIPPAFVVASTTMSDGGTTTPSVSTTGLPTGTIFAHISSTPPEGAWLLDGQTIADCRSYCPAFWEWLLKNAVGPTDNALEEEFARLEKEPIYQPWTMPVLTADGTMGGSEYAVATNGTVGSGYEAYKSFDGASGGAKTYASITKTTTGYFTYYSPKVLKLTSVVFTNPTAGAVTNRPMKVTISGSNDNVIWTELVVDVEYASTANSAKQTVEIPESKYGVTTPGYKYFKFDIVNSGGANIDLPEITLHGEEYLNTDYVRTENMSVRVVTPERYEYELKTYKISGGFVVDLSTGDVRLPSITQGTLWGADSTNIGQSLAAGLPNIEGSLPKVRAYETAQGAFYQTGGSGYNHDGPTGSGTFGFDASLSNPIYGNSDTVQPMSVRISWCIQVYGSATELSQQESATLTSQLQNRAMKNLSNVDSNIDFIVTSGHSEDTWYRIYKSGWIEQGGLLAESSAGGQYTITLPYEMADMTYSVHTSNNNRARVDDKWDYGTVGGVRVSTTQIKLSRGRGGGAIAWEVKGMKAASSASIGFVGQTDIDITGYVGVDLIYQFDIKYNDQNITYALNSGETLPEGLNLVGNKITGTPTQLTTHTCSIRAYVADGSEEPPYIDLTVRISVLEKTDDVDTLSKLRQDFEEHRDDETRHITSNEREIVHRISNTLGGVGMPDFKRMVKMHKGFDVSWNSFPNTIYKINVPGYLYLVSTHQTIVDVADDTSTEAGAADYMVYIASHPGYLFRPQCTASSQSYGQVESHFMRRCKYFTSIGHPHDDSIMVPIDPGKNTYIRILDATSAGPYHTWYFVPCVDLSDRYNPEDYFTRVGKASGAFGSHDDSCPPWHLGNLSDFRDEIFEGSWSDNFNDDGSLKLPIVDIFGATLVDENKTNKFIGSLSSDNRYVSWYKDNVRITEENYNEYLGYAYWPEGGLGTSSITFTDCRGYVSVNTYGTITYTSYEDPQLSYNGHSLILSEENKEMILSLITVTSPFGKGMIDRTSTDYEFYFCTYVNATRKIFRAYKGLFKDGAFTFGPSGMSVELPYDSSYVPSAATVYAVGFKEDGSRYIVGTVEYEDITSVGTKLNLRLTTAHYYSNETAKTAPVGTSFVAGDSKWHLVDPIRSGDDREWVHVDHNGGHWVLRKFTSAEIDAVLAKMDPSKISAGVAMDVNINTHYAEARTRFDILSNMKDNWCVVFENYDWRNLVTNPTADSAYQLSCCCYFTARKRDDYDPTLPGSNPPFGLDTNPNYTYIYEYTSNGVVTAQGFTPPSVRNITTAGNKHCCSIMWDFGNSVASGYRDDFYLSLRPIEPTSIDTTPYW